MRIRAACAGQAALRARATEPATGGRQRTLKWASGSKSSPSAIPDCVSSVRARRADKAPRRVDRGEPCVRWAETVVAERASHPLGSDGRNALEPPTGRLEGLVQVRRAPIGARASARPGRRSPPRAGRRRARGRVSRAAPGDEPARRRLVRAAPPIRGGDGAGDDPAVGDAGVRTWGRRAAERWFRRWLPHPAWRTPGPCRRPRASAREASACSGDVWSSGGTCVREATGAPGRNAATAGLPTGPDDDFGSGARKRRSAPATGLARAGASRSGGRDELGVRARRRRPAPRQCPARCPTATRGRTRRRPWSGPSRAPRR